MIIQLEHTGLTPSKETLALEEFLEKWTNREHVKGALLTGSHAIGLADEFSDVDIYIILSDDSPERERGDHVIRDCVIEYNADPIRYIRALQEEQHKNGLLHCARKISTGIILFDRDGTIAQLKREAEIRMATPFMRTDETNIEMAKYYMWDQFEDLRRLEARNSAGFAYAYYCGVQNIINHYARFCGIETLRPVRMYQFITDPMFRSRYRVHGFSDLEFCALVEICMQKPDINAIERLTHYMQEKMGGFVLDGWRLRVAVPVTVT